MGSLLKYESQNVQEKFYTKSVNMCQSLILTHEGGNQQDGKVNSKKDVRTGIYIHSVKKQEIANIILLS